jgi:hypothetical protein
LQTGNPSRLVVRRVVQSDLGDALERVLHMQYSTYRVRGEWFYPSRAVTAIARSPEAWSDDAFDVALGKGYEEGFGTGYAMGWDAALETAEIVVARCRK